MVKRPELAEPVEIFKGWINRRHDALIVNLQTFNGTNLVDLRKYVMHRDGCLKPSAKGIAVSVRRLRELHNAIGKAVVRAEELGLIDKDGVE
ncbi:transcriptional coactivator p15/PC4 family protein [Bradyrhizobium sp. TM239]|uniref:transcriptional coactivator p15/PC4 family protein n=1 Tax=Bradyrhizobium sp. TM239 TaxID=2599802 RepID=UPI0027D605FE|nr:hypothetical protein TM239_63360 [Bradyrhizobium sp. TM239]